MRSIVIERASRLWCLAAVVVAVVGCGRGVGATATGVVTVNGKPAPAGVMVRFQPQVPNGSTSIGVTDDQGRFEMRFNARTPGVMPGESVVQLVIRESYDAKGVPFIPETLRAVKIPESCGLNSTLMKTVNPGVNVIDIDLDALR